MRMRSFTPYLIAGLTATLLLGSVGDAAARRHADGKCRKPDGGWKMCAPRGSSPRGPLYLWAPLGCHSDYNVLARAKATKPSELRKLTLTLDGVVVATTRSRGPKGIALGIDCASLSPGPHTLTATLVMRTGARTSLSRTLTRVDGPAPDDLF
jgi:hypothetical protein